MQTGKLRARFALLRAGLRQSGVSLFAFLTQGFRPGLPNAAPIPGLDFKRHMPLSFSKQRTRMFFCGNIRIRAFWFKRAFMFEEYFLSI